MEIEKFNLSPLKNNFINYHYHLINFGRKGFHSDKFLHQQEVLINEARKNCNRGKNARNFSDIFSRSENSYYTYLKKAGTSASEIASKRRQRNIEKVKNYHSAKYSVQQIANMLGCSTTTVYNYLRLAGINISNPI